MKIRTVICNDYLKVINNDIYGEHIFDILYMVDLAYFLKKLYPNCLILLEESQRKQTLYFDKYYLIKKKADRYYLYIDGKLILTANNKVFLFNRIIQDVSNNVHTEINIKEIKTSLSKGYIKVGEMVVKNYSGKYGKGYKVYIHNPVSTIFCIVNYYILEDENYEEN